MKKRASLLLLAAIVSFGAIAQSAGSAEQSKKVTDYRFGKFWDNWFISVGGGASRYFGENWNGGKFFDRLTPAIDVAAGKWVSPEWGGRIQYNGIEMNGYTAGEDFDFDYIGIHGDIMMNLSTMIYGYNPKRFYELIPFVGMGWAQSKVADERNNELLATAGLINKFRVNQAFDVNLELRGGLVNQRFDGMIGGNQLEGPVSATVGLTYHFGGSKARQFNSAPITTVIQNKEELEALRGQLAQADKRNNSLQKELEALKKAKAQAPAQVQAPVTPVVEKVAEKACMIKENPVFFKFNQSQVSDAEKARLKYIADEIKASKGKKFVIAGYADAATGSASANQKISDARAKAVYDILVNEFQVSPDQLSYVGKGGVADLFDKNPLNRVAILSAE